MENFLAKLQRIIISTTIFLFPLFFLTTTQDFFQINKFYLLALATLLMLVIWSLRVVVNKKVTFRFSLINGTLLLFLIAQAISVLLMAPNKLAAIFSLPTGFGPLFFLTLFFFVLTLQSEDDDLKTYWKALRVSAIVTAVIAIIFFFNPFKTITLPSGMQFIKNQTFNTLGSPLELVLFLGFFFVHEGVSLLGHFAKKGKPYDQKELAFGAGLFAVVGLGLVLNLAFLLIPQKLGVSATRLPPFSLSWYSTVETLKNPMSALFGVGVDNFSSLFTKVKTVGYNHTDLWQLNFSKAASFFLQLWTETGLAGLLTFILTLLVAGRELLSSKKEVGNIARLISFAYLLLVLLFLPSSLIVLFLLFLKLASIAISSTYTKKKTINLASFAPVYFAVPVATFILSAGLLFSLGKVYAAEYHFNQSIVGLNTGDGQRAYNNLVRAIQENPYNETYHIVFSQLNLLIANNVAARSQKDKNGQSKLSDQERQIISQTIQQAILEAKKVVQLNGDKEQGWENLALIYRSILNAAQGADSWTMAAYQRAIAADPVNPTLRLNLGGVYYSLRNYPAAAQMFNQAVQLKSDWANAHYNLAWALFQNGNYPQAVAAMQDVLRLVDVKTPDYQKAKKELEDFKKKLPKPNEPAASAEGKLQPIEQQPLTLPTPPTPKVSPKINLPQGAEPPATPEGQTQQ